MKSLFTLLATLLLVQGAFAWGQKGHDVTAYIAECHLTPEAAQRIDKVLGGHSLVYYANWLDNASHTPAYAYTKTWHYRNIDEGETLESMKTPRSGDVLTAVTALVVKLKMGGMTPDEEAANLKMLIHLVGDMHCPMHAGHQSDLGGNQIPVFFFDTKTNLHSVWDSRLPEVVHKWSYTEWQQQLDRHTPDEVADIQRGEPRDWFLETYAICTDIYKRSPKGTKISYDYINLSAPIIEQQFVRAGYRLARLLNEIYG